MFERGKEIRPEKTVFIQSSKHNKSFEEESRTEKKGGKKKVALREAERKNRERQ